MRHGIARIRGNEQSSMDACPAAADTQHAGAPHWVRLGASAHREPKLAKAKKSTHGFTGLGRLV